MKNLVIISELFIPEETSTGYIMGEIAKAMITKYKVKAICGPEIYDKNKKQNSRNIEYDTNIEIIRVKGIEEDKNSKISRIKKFSLMSWRMYKVAKKIINNGDVVLLVTNPFPLLLFISYLKKRKDFYFELLVHDVFPEPLRKRIQIPSIVYKIILRLFNKAYASADLIISIGRDMTTVLKNKISKYKKNPNIIQIENWGDINTIYPLKKDRTDNTITIQYAGNIGKSQNLNLFVSLLKGTNNPSLKFDIWGVGEMEQALKDLVIQQNIKSISFNGSYSRSQQNQILNNCDIALVSLRKDVLGFGVPSKTYNIMASGRPILYIGPLESEIALMIKENEIGFCFDPDDNEGITNFLSSINVEMLPFLQDMGKRARDVVEKKYSKDIILKKFYQYI